MAYGFKGIEPVCGGMHDIIGPRMHGGRNRKLTLRFHPDTRSRERNEQEVE